MSELDKSKRQFMKKLAYTAPLLLTLQVKPSAATVGSRRHGRHQGFGDNKGRRDGSGQRGAGRRHGGRRDR